MQHAIEIYARGNVDKYTASLIMERIVPVKGYKLFGKSEDQTNRKK
jgi:hypothetical protein